jgi:probable F420-dependent oxidoreductase
MGYVAGTMEFGLQVGMVDWARLRDVAQMAESLGFHTLYFPDHLIHELPERQAAGQPAYDPMIQAAVAAEVTRRIRIGHLVLCNLFRHPAVTARSLATLDELSGGRAVAGLGTGWTETEFRATGMPLPEIGTRLRMLDEALTCLRGLWGEAPFTFEGEFYRFREAALLPRPVQRPHPPIVLGGGGRGLLRVAARHADVLNIISDVGRAGYISLATAGKLDGAHFRAKVDFLRAETARAGRDPRAVRVSNVCFTTILTDSPAATRAVAEGTAGMFGATPEVLLGSPLFMIGTPDECVQEIRRRSREWEVSETVFAFSDEQVLRRLGEEVLPRV